LKNDPVIQQPKLLYPQKNLLLLSMAFEIFLAVTWHNFVMWVMTSALKMETFFAALLTLYQATRCCIWQQNVNVISSFDVFLDARYACSSCHKCV